MPGARAVCSTVSVDMSILRPLMCFNERERERADNENYNMNCEEPIASAVVHYKPWPSTWRGET